MAIFKSLLAIALAAILTAQAAPQLEARDLVIPTISGWTSIGCWSDITSRRTLQAISNTDPNFMTIENCLNFCLNKNFNLAGVENGDECWCSNAMDFGPSPKNASECNTACSGDAFEPCGGPNALLIHRKVNIPTITV